MQLTGAPAICEKSHLVADDVDLPQGVCGPCNTGPGHRQSCQTLAACRSPRTRRACLLRSHYLGVCESRSTGPVHRQDYQTLAACRSPRASRACLLRSHQGACEPCSIGPDHRQAATCGCVPHSSCRQPLAFDTAIYICPTFVRADVQGLGNVQPAFVSNSCTLIPNDVRSGSNGTSF
jgi:hypothetical protein